jgi:D-alanyl-D-alanine carboxypeptidase
MITTRRSALRLLGITAVTATAGLAAGTAYSQQAVAAPIRLGDVQQAIENVAATDGVVGAIGRAYVDGRLAGEGTAGSRLLGGKGGCIPPGSRYRIASQTKMMEAAIVVQLVGEGRLRLEDKLSDVLPEMAEHDWVELADQITVRHLIRHTSGVPDFIESGWFDVFDFTTVYTQLDQVKAARSVARRVELGQYYYSTTNYVLLGMIIERVTGNGRAGEFERRLFEPLGMRDTYLAVRISDQVKGPHGHGYYPDAHGVPRDVDRINATIGSEGAISTARDVSRFYRALSEGRLVPEDLRRQVPQPMPGLCGGTVGSAAGSMPGINSTTFFSTDGRIQFAVAVTLEIDNMQAMEIGDATTAAAEAVLGCA